MSPSIPIHHTPEWQLEQARRFMAAALTDWGKKFWRNEIERHEREITEKSQAKTRNMEAFA